SMPKDKIQKAIDVGTGAGSDGAAIERVLYEGYGPAGVAVLVEALTDNRNRASAEIRHAFSKHGGNLGEPGSVAWIFEKKGAIVLDGSRYSEDDLIGAIDAGAEDVREDEGNLRVICDLHDLTAVREALEGEGIEFESAGLVTEPKSTVELKGHDAERVLKLLEALDDQDDVDEVYANFAIPAEGLEQLAS
ncbi:MAG TPA: YebC/PmpR family DNA-binding transcriptional regulator, partial [Solirubrobacterales bacterium]|nr:YebC/PmpR family DNA-binding transcriptional regulator [Solirubrobacterales bacterium]